MVLQSFILELAGMESYRLDASVNTLGMKNFHSNGLLTSNADLVFVAKFQRLDQSKVSCYANVVVFDVKSRH